MFRVNTSSVLRMAGFAVLVIVATAHFAGLVLPAVDAPRKSVVAFYVGESLTVALLMLYVSSFWINLRAAPVERPGRGHALRLLVQAVAGLLIATELMYVVAAQAPLVLERRLALRWLAGQSVVLCAWSTLLWLVGPFETLAELKSAPAALGFVLTTLSVLTWQAFAFCAGWLAASETRQRRELARLNAELHVAQQALAERSRLEERLHISRELHDSLGHHLVALNLQLDLAQRVDAAKRPSHVDAAANLSRGMLGEVRRVVSALREDAPVDLRQAWLAVQASVPEPRIHVDISVDLTELAPAITRTLERCVQEGVNNVLRHAGAANFWIDAIEVDDTIELRLRDDGVGCAKPIEGNGLTGMRERVQSHGGSLTIGAGGEGGLRIVVALPLKASR